MQIENLLLKIPQWWMEWVAVYAINISIGYVLACTTQTSNFFILGIMSLKVAVIYGHDADTLTCTGLHDMSAKCAHMLTFDSKCFHHAPASKPTLCKLFMLTWIFCRAVSWSLWKKKISYLKSLYWNWLDVHRNTWKLKIMLIFYSSYPWYFFSASDKQSKTTSLEGFLRQCPW